MTNYLNSAILKYDIALDCAYDYTHFDMLLSNSLSRQIIVVCPEQKYLAGAPTAKLSLYQKLANQWFCHDKLSNIPATLGKNGVVSAIAKVEGDKMTPSGLFSISELFGYSTVSYNSHGMKYHPIIDKLDDNGYYWDKFIDDSNSQAYNTWVSGNSEAKSFEQMRIAGHKEAYAAYEYGAVIAYNTDPIIPKRGSAIFLHVYKNSHHATDGCVALAKDTLKELLAILKPEYLPSILILP